jgi:hypothetical protein
MDPEAKAIAKERLQFMENFFKRLEMEIWRIIVSKHQQG